MRDFQAVISAEIKDQMKELEGKLPDVEMACVGGGSNAIGSFYHFIQHPEVRLIGCEAAGRGVDTFETAATIATGKLGIFHGMKSYFCQDKQGQIAPVYSISAGLDYPGIGPEHAASTMRVAQNMLLLLMKKQLMLLSTSLALKVLFPRSKAPMPLPMHESLLLP